MGVLAVASKMLNRLEIERLNHLPPANAPIHDALLLGKN
jgi:hypothetical protein